MTKKSKRVLKKLISNSTYGFEDVKFPYPESMYGAPLYDDAKPSIEVTLEVIKNDVARHNAEHAQMLAFLTELQLRTGEILAILKDDVPKPMMVGVYPKPVEGNTEPLWEEE